MSTSVMFTGWGMGGDDPHVDLWAVHDGMIVEATSVDIAELPKRRDLIARMSERMRDRLFVEARRVGVMA